ncbi:MAG: nitrogen fixation protein NifM [Candidatus Sedimenticola sp. PURPLELP]
MILSEQRVEQNPEFNYHLLRSALDGFDKNLAQLDEQQYQATYRKALKSYELETLVLESDEASGVVVFDGQLEEALDELASRYENQEDFVADLETNGLDVDGLRQALYRELMFDSVMQRVAAGSADVKEIDINLFYEMHRERFQSPELRTASHILITVNPEYPENTYAAARTRMEQLLEKLNGRVNRFQEFAKRYSECPTAMDGGKLGEVKRGQLYPELDAMLFAMAESGISPIVESELGFHILLCEKIKPGKVIPLSKAEPRIREVLMQRQQRNCQKAWLNSLQQKGTDSSK